MQSGSDNAEDRRRSKRIQPPRSCRKADSSADKAASPLQANSSKSGTKRKSDEENTLDNPENITPKAARRKREHKAIKEPPPNMPVPLVSKSSHRTSLIRTRTGTSGAMHNYGSSEAQRNEAERQDAKAVAEKYTYRDIREVLTMASPSDKKGKAAARVSKVIADSLERLLGGKHLPRDSNLDKAMLKPFVDGIKKWSSVGSATSAEKPLYGHFAEFVLFVAHCLKSMPDSDLNVARLVLPSMGTDFTPNDSNDNRRVNMAFYTRDSGTSVDRVDDRTYADMLCVMEAKANIVDQDEALGQLIMYSKNLYMTQPNRRFLWGLTVCADVVYATVMLNDSVLVSPAIKISDPIGRKKLVSLLVNWSTCSEDRLGYDPTMRRITDNRGCRATGGSMGDGGGGDVDAIRYEIDCYDDKTGRTRKYATRRTIMVADDIFGRHTRCFVAVPVDNNGETATDGSEEVVIKDAWPPAEHDVLGDPRSEIRFLRIIRDTYEKSPPSDFIYPKLVVGGHVRLDPDNEPKSVDTTNIILSLLGAKRIDIPSDVKKPPTWQHQLLRAHRRIVMSPVGHSIKSVENEEELIVVLAEAMRCHSSLVKDCHILHRDISTNNILVVRDKSDSSAPPRGLLIDFDFAIEVSTEERKARAEKSGTLPYMSIANLLNLECDRMALDDWESLLYIVCWLATIGINSKDRREVDLTRHRPIYRWNNGRCEDIADEKRGHMDSYDSFREKIAKHFCKEYPLLSLLSRQLHKALFANKNCPGSQKREQEPEGLDLFVNLDNLSAALGQKPGDIRDPIVDRNEHVDEIVNDLQHVMGTFDNHAKNTLTQR